MPFINARSRIVLAIVLQAALWISGCGRAEVEPPVHGGSPNVLLISLDTLRADHVGSYGYDRNTSPFLDELAAQGVRFQNAFVNTHSTGPSHATLLSSRYQESHRVLYDHYARSEAARVGKLNEWLAANSIVPANLEMMQEVFAQSGYRTVAITGGGFVGRSTGMNRGFDEYHDAFHDIQPGADRLRDLIESRPVEDQRPVFAFFHTFQIHSPYDSPAEYRDLFKNSESPTFRPGEDARSYVERVANEHLATASELPSNVINFLRLQYDRSIRYTDDVLRELFSELDRVGFLDNYIVIITSDHGEEFGEHGNLQHTDQLFEGLVRIPIIISGTRVPRGIVDERMASTIDIAPTILALSGLGPLRLAEGNDLLAPAVTPPDEQFVFMQRGAVAYALREPRWKLIEGPPPHPFSRSSPLPIALYDLRNDPEESHNIAADHPERTKKMLNGLQYMKSRLKSEASTGGEGTLSTEEINRLKSLGYIK